MNIKKLSFSGFMLSFSIFFTASLAAANNQVQIVSSGNNYFSIGILLVALIGAFGIFMGGINVPISSIPDPRDGASPGEEGWA